MSFAECLSAPPRIEQKEMAMSPRAPSSSALHHGAALIICLVAISTGAVAQALPAGIGQSWDGFVENRGQWDSAALYRGAFGPVSIWLQKDGWTVAIEERTGFGEGPVRIQDAEPLPVETVRSVAVRMRFEGSQPQRTTARDATAARHNWFVGDRARWATDVQAFRTVRLEDLYPGISVVAREQDRHFEYDLEVQPGARLDAVVIACSGHDALGIDANGDLLLETPYGIIRQTAPASWEVDGAGSRVAVASSWRILEGGRVGFDVSRIDPKRTLIVDPGIIWSNLGGGAADDNPGLGAMALSAGGNVNVGGVVVSTTFPVTPGAYQTTLAGAGTWDGWVARFNSSGTLLWSTYVGGNGYEAFRALAIGPGDRVTVVGHSSSTNFPTLNAFDATLNGTGFFGTGDGVLATLDPSLTGSAQLIWSTFLGGSQDERLNSVSVDGAGIVTAAGWTYSSNIPGIPIPTAYQTILNGPQDAILAQLNPALAGNAQLSWFTFLGGTGSDHLVVVAPRPGGTFAVTGATTSSDYPIVNGFAASAPLAWDGTVSVLNPAAAGAAQLVYSSYLGGNNNDYGNALAVDKAGVLVVGGYTSSSNFPTTPGAFDTTYNNGVDIFVTRIDPTLPPSAQILASTYLGGSGDENINDLVLDGSGGVHAVGAVSSTNYPTTPGAYQTMFQGGSPDGWGPFDAFAFLLDPTLSTLAYSTYIGGTAAYDFAYNVVRDECGNVLISGLTRSSDFPSTSGTYSALDDVFLLKLDMLPTGVARYGASTAGCSGSLEIAVRSNPVNGNAAFAVTCAGAPPLASGILAISGGQLTSPLLVSGLSVWINPASPGLLLFPATSSGAGYAVVNIPVPPGPVLVGMTGYAQFAWADPCPPGGLSGSCALAITVQ